MKSKKTGPEKQQDKGSKKRLPVKPIYQMFDDPW